MRKSHFTRKNFIVIALFFFWALMIGVSALAIDATNPVFAKNNPIQSLAVGMGFPKINGSFNTWLLVPCALVMIIVAAAAIIFEVRLAAYYGDKPTRGKWWGIYAATIVICLGLFGGISYAGQYPWEAEYVKNAYLFLAAAVAIGTIIFLVLGLLVLNICFIWVNIRNIDKPFRFFGGRGEQVAASDEMADAAELAAAKEQGSLAESFGDTVTENGVAPAGQPNIVRADDSAPISDKERVFPGLCSVDYAYIAQRPQYFEDNLELNEICVRFRNYLAKEEKLYFDETTIRCFIAGLAASHFIILEGLSGTGKSSLARYFSEFISEKSFFEAVQATWRDKTSILGYFNDFSKSYNETEFLKRLYEFNYKTNNLNFMVLDELNISRIEYYFADFLSVLEYPVEDWKIKIMQFPYDFEPPVHLRDGILKIPANTYFIGTANKDDSTYTITDKVYDRAITINFDDRNEPFEVEGEAEKITLSFARLQQLFEQANAIEENRMSVADTKKFRELADFTYDTFDITYGNRIMHQIELFVPVFVSCGGTKEEALDFMFSRKVVAKLEGRFEDYIKPGLMNLKALILKNYGSDGFAATNKTIDRLLKKL